MDASNRLKRLRSKYRLVITNEDTFEEVITFKLNRLSVYIAMSSIFVITIIVTVSLIIFTPLKYYLPGSGYGNVKQMKAYRELKMRTDSMQIALDQQARFNEDIEKVLKGKFVIKDTNKLKLPTIENVDD
jgi:hypothetical protein